MPLLWVTIGGTVLLLKGWKWFAFWLIPGIPPPGPFGGETDQAMTVQECFNRLTAILRRFHKSLTPREQLVFKAGLRASHIEEALAQGEIDRAQSHFQELVKLLRQLQRKDTSHVSE